MATRLYLPSSAAGAPLVSPAFDASWEATGSAIRQLLDTEKNEASGAYATQAVATALNSPAGAVDVLIAQFISAPISGSTTIDGTVKGQVRALESNAAADLRMQCVIRVVSGDGTSVTGTLIASSAAALSNEFNTAIRNIKIPLNGSTAVSSVTANDGDRLVVEIGYRKHESATTSRTGTFDLGAVSGATDLPEDETTTTQGAPWIEFSNTITFKDTNRRVSQSVMEVLTRPDTAKARASQAALEVLTRPDTAKARISQVVLEVIYPSSNPTTPTAVTRAWGYIIG